MSVETGLEKALKPVMIKINQTAKGVQLTVSQLSQLGYVQEGQQLLKTFVQQNAEMESSSLQKKHVMTEM